MKLSHLVRMLNPAHLEMPDGVCPDDIEITGISTDSRQVEQGNVFICIRGTHIDSHTLASDAVERGAAAIVAERAILPSVPSVIVENTRAAAAELWSSYFGSPQNDMKTIAVTGTNGKTSVTHILHRILTDSGIHAGLVGTVCSRIGDEEMPHIGGSEVGDAAAAMTTPDPKFLYGTMAEMRDLGVTHVVMEASSHALAQHKLDPICADVAVFTGLSPEHLDFHGTMENYLCAKSVLFRTAKRCIINSDDEYADALINLAPNAYLSVGVGNGAGLRARHIKHKRDGVAYRLTGDGISERIFCRMPGAFGVYNSLLAAAAALSCGIPADVIADSVAHFPGVPGRMETVYDDGKIRVVRDFAHTPEAMRRATEIMRESVRGRLIVLFGCGGDRDKSKRPAMGRIAAQTADITVVTSDNSRTENPIAIIDEILEGVGSAPCRVIPDRREAICTALSIMKKKDVLLLLGKGHENYQIDKWGIHPFDEREIVAEYMRKKSGEVSDKDCGGAPDIGG